MEMQKVTIKFNSQQSSIASLFNMKMNCHAIVLPRINLVPRGYIILDKNHSFHGILGDSPENLQKFSFYDKFYHPEN